MKTKFFALAFALLVGVFAFAQSVNPVSGHVSSDTAGSVAAIIKYIGTGSAATVEIDATTGDIELEIADVADNTNVDTGSVCAGGTANSLDVSDAQCDTFGEVLDLVNASTHWRMVLVGALRSDSTNNTIFTLAESQATLKAGLPLYFDSTVSTHTTVALVPPRCVTDISCYMTPSGKLLENPFGGKQIDLRWVEGYATYSTAASLDRKSVV